MPSVPPYKMWEVVRRSNEGPFCEEEEFLQKRLAPKVKEVVEKYDIEFDPETPIPSDDSLADRVWEAAVELFLEVGVLNQDTNRIIEFSEEEVNEALKAKPEKFLVGKGKEAKYLEHREVEDENHPFVIFSPDITYDEDHFLPVSIAYLRENLLDGFCAPILDEFIGMKIKSGNPVEIGGSMEHAMSLREAARLVGKPGIFLVAVGTAESDFSQIAVSNEDWGVRTTDSRLVGSVTELMTNNMMINKAIHYQQYGCYSGSLTGALYGGYAGGAEGTAVVQAAYHLKGLMVHQSHYQMNFPYHLKHFSNTTRELLWVVSTFSQAVARNTGLINVSNGFANAGPATEMLLLEAVAHAMTSTVSGANLWETAPARNKYQNRGTPLEARLAAETGHAVAEQGISRGEANEIVNKLLERYEDDIADAPLGKEFRECYDLRTSKPEQEYLDLYKEVKETVNNLGLDLS